MYTETEVQKDLLKSKAKANLSHYDGSKGELIYNCNIFGKPHEFPISVTQRGLGGVMLTEDMKGANFNVIMKGSELSRWIKKAVVQGKLVNLSNDGDDQTMSGLFEIFEEKKLK